MSTTLVLSKGIFNISHNFWGCIKIYLGKHCMFIDKDFTLPDMITFIFVIPISKQKLRNRTIMYFKVPIARPPFSRIINKADNDNSLMRINRSENIIKYKYK